MANFTYELSKINIPSAGIKFCEAYNIPWRITERGENSGRIRTYKTRQTDRDTYFEVRKLLEDSGYGYLVDHGAVFRDANDKPVITFSPYGCPRIPKALEEILSGRGYSIEMIEHGIYAAASETFVIRSRWVY